MLHKKGSTMTEPETRIVCGDCIDTLKAVPDNSFDLIFTSPPYADSRMETYGGIHPDSYSEWFLPRSKEFLRTLKPSGTFILNIKEKVVKRERSTYVLRLIQDIRQQGWLWTEDFIWHKTNCSPGKWPNRFRDAWEHCLQFNKSFQFNMYQDEVMTDIGPWADKRLRNLSSNDRARMQSSTGSGFGKKISNWIGRGKVYPSNVLHLPTANGCRNHSAMSPAKLPEWFIKLFSKPGDWVLDPFCGSGTTCSAAAILHRNSMGIDILQKYADLSSLNCAMATRHVTTPKTAANVPNSRHKAEPAR
jgi:DNA modification methylase